MRTLSVNFLKDEDGQGMLEYVLIISLVAVVAITAITTFGNRVNELFDIDF